MRVVFSRSNTILGFLIRVLTRSDWNHCDLLFDDSILIGAISGYGVQKVTLIDRLRGPYDIRSYRIDEVVVPNEQAAREFAEAQVGKSYDYTAVIAFLLPWRANWNVKRKWFCSELVAETINQGGLRIARDNLWRVTPNFLDTSPLLVILDGPHSN